MGILDPLKQSSGDGRGQGLLDPLLLAEPGPTQGFGDQPAPGVSAVPANSAPAGDPFAGLFGNAPPAPPMPSPGVGDRLMAGLMNFANARGFLPALAGGVSGLATGQRTDPAALLQAQQSAQMQALVLAGVPPMLAHAATLNPALMRAIAPQLRRPVTTTAQPGSPPAAAAPTAAPAASTAPPAAASPAPLAQARAAIAFGIPRDAVVQRLQQLGIDPKQL